MENYTEITINGIWFCYRTCDHQCFFDQLFAINLGLADKITDSDF